MPDIIRIIIKGASGYGPVDEAYEDSWLSLPHPSVMSTSRIR